MERRDFLKASVLMPIVPLVPFSDWKPSTDDIIHRAFARQRERPVQDFINPKVLQDWSKPSVPPRPQPPAAIPRRPAPLPTKKR